jgi:hypothetical protein
VPHVRGLVLLDLGGCRSHVKQRSRPPYIRHAPTSHSAARAAPVANWLPVA